MALLLRSFVAVAVGNDNDATMAAIAGDGLRLLSDDDFDTATALGVADDNGAICAAAIDDDVDGAASIDITESSCSLTSASVASGSVTVADASAFLWRFDCTCACNRCSSRNLSLHRSQRNRRAPSRPVAAKNQNV